MIRAFESLLKKEAETTMRCSLCHGFKSMLCRDQKRHKHIPKEENSDDQGLTITHEDEVDMLFKQGDRM
jgi:hypothetical protein